ncbi:MAG: restriction endonuclease subunit S [Candidatus Electrothrix sp. AU1_5]|nr:restriction endonuclease subunit S [Candidatus Electrothrix gigas]
MSGVTPSGTVKEYLTVEPCSLQAENSVVKESFTTYNHAEIQGMKPYPKYKDSGVEWLGRIPDHWKCKKIKHITQLQGGFAFKSKSFTETGIPIVRIGDIQSIIDWECCKKVPQYIKVTKDFLIKKHDTLIALSGATTGKTTFIDSEPEYSYINQRVAKASFDNKMIYFLLSCSNVQELIKLIAAGSAQENISNAQIGNITVCIPSDKQEQTAIAAFLDRKTADIDKLIANKERLIKLYEEKKQAVINQAVTKGLDPDAEMKDSGVEWLGEIPKHWEVMRLRHLFEIKKRIAGELGYDVLSITQRGIKIKDIKSMDGQISSDYSKYQLVMKGDFAMNHMDLLTGYVDLSKYNGVTSPDYRVFSLSDTNNCDRYFLYLFQLGYKRKIFYAFGRGAAQFGRWRFPAEEFKAFGFPIPPVSEQTAIAHHIETQCNRIDAIINKLKKQINLFKEYRTALISEAVTGKIDVRNNG